MNVPHSHSEGDFDRYVTLSKDGKPISRARSNNAPDQVPSHWRLNDIVRRTKLHFLAGLQQFTLIQAAESSRDQDEWLKFLRFLKTHNMVAVVISELFEFYILPPETLDFSNTIAAYRVVTLENTKHASTPFHPKMPSIPPSHNVEEFASAAVSVKEQDSSVSEGTHFCVHNVSQPLRNHSHISESKNCGRPEGCEPKKNELRSACEPSQTGLHAKNHARADPSYLKTLGQAHSGWVFGAIAELVDNSRDAKATKLEISIEMIYSKRAGKHIPMLSIVDDGLGMTYQDIVRMTSLGHKAPDEDDPERLGRFGVGFKTGAMRLGKNSLVLTQTADSRSIAFLSQSLNEGKDNLEIPIVSFHRQGHVMEVDTSVQSEALAKYNLKAIKEFSPFNKYLVGEKAGLFHENTGTQIYIWDLDEWGSNYSLEWHEKSSFSQGDICIRSRRTRSRPGQVSHKVPIDYSLRSYLEVIFLVPRIKIYVQGSRVKSRPLEKSLHKTVVETGDIMGKSVQLTLGRCQIESEAGNCGVFLYWHGRLIEAYKRVGGMIHSADMGRGVIGVIDVTDLMNDGKGGVWVLNNKQGFQDCESYAHLESWLGHTVDKYWDKNFDKIQPKKRSSFYNPDHEWVQCDKCRKWRMLTPDFDIQDLPQEWFCYMEPFDGCCEIPEEKVEGGLITLSTKRSGYEYNDYAEGVEKGCDQITAVTSPESPKLKKPRKALAKACKKSR